MTVEVSPPKAPPPHQPPPAPPRRRSPWGRLSRADAKASPYIFIAPFFILFAAFGAFPILYTAYVSLHDWGLLGSRGYVGLDNYVVLLGDRNFWNAAANTFGMFFVAHIPQLLVALMIAHLLNRRIRARTLFRMSVLAPNITSVVAVGIVFGFIFAERYGLAYWLLEATGIGGFDWRSAKWSSWLAISIMVDWRWTGYMALIYLAAMQAIPRELYEAAAVDGAGPWRQFWRITVPLIRPTILFTVILATIGGMQLFTEPLLFAYGRIQGGTQRQFQTLAMYIYEVTFERNFEFGYGAAISWMLFVIIIAFAAVNFLLVRRSVRGES